MHDSVYDDIYGDVYAGIYNDICDDLYDDIYDDIAAPAQARTIVVMVPCASASLRLPVRVYGLTPSPRLPGAGLAERGHELHIYIR